MHRKYRYGFIVLLFVGCLLMIHSKASRAQDENASDYAIKVLSRSYEDSIALRWAPNNPIAWHYLNQYGYSIERYTIIKNGEMLRPPKKKVLTREPLKPMPLKEWEAMANTSDKAAIAAQAIYGETFEVGTSQSGSRLTQIVNKNREMESRFSFALSSADFSTEVAKLSGLLFVDNKVQPNNRYLYKVCPLVPKEKLDIDTGYVYTGLDEAGPLPKPRRLSASFRENIVSISWDYRFQKNEYIAYRVERSSGNTENFHPVHKKPYINTISDSLTGQRRMVFIDSVPQLNKKYSYRIKGINSFGELGPPSDTVSGFSREDIGVNPKITDYKVFENYVLSVDWNYPDSLSSKIQGFWLQRAKDDQGPYVNTHDQMVDSTKRSLTDTLPGGGSYYYKIIVEDLQGKRLSSYPVLVNTIDSVPPKSPKALEGNIDTNGVVRLEWSNNKEKDLLGYRVYRSNFSGKDYIQVTNEHTSKSFYRDTININTLTNNIYYKITAIDIHFNEGEFSEPLKLNRPDLIAPVKPVFKNAKSDRDGIYLEWSNSTSSDVSKHLLYRRNTKDKKWKLIEIFREGEESYIDSSNNEKGKMYRYTLIAVDGSGLESDPAKPVTLRRYNPGIKTTVKNLKYSVDRKENSLTLKWNYPKGMAKRFLIYRSVDQQPFSQYKSVDSGKRQFKDSNLKVNQNYQYRVRTVYINNTHSKFSQVVSIKF